MRKRAVWVEPLFGEAKQWHGLRRFRLRCLEHVNMEALLTAAGQNLKRLLRRQGWGYRPWPASPGALVPNHGTSRTCSSQRGRATNRASTSKEHTKQCLYGYYRNPHKKTLT